jgi:PadR family transcriptional regulator, regulatory protein PadR
MDPTAHLPLAPRDLMILAVLAERPLHGYGLVKAVEARSSSGVLLDPANLYRVLRRMRGLAWIEEADDAEERRRTYRITGAGRAVLVAELGRLERLLEHARPAVADGG